MKDVSSLLKERDWSPQAKAAMATYAKHKAWIDKQILERVELLNDPYTSEETKFNLVFDDGVFDPWFECDPEDYGELVAEEGNAEDEVKFLASVWESVLIQTNYVRYAAVIAKFKEIDVKGL